MKKPSSTKIDIHYSPYELKLKDFPTADSRRGALLFVDGGYADLHPWPELGDLPIEEELEALKNGVPTNLGEKSLEFAKIDALAREKGINLLNEVPKTKNHLHIGRPSANFDFEALKRELELGAYDRVKLKVSDFLSPLEFETFKKLVRLSTESKNLKIRLDLNYSFGDRAQDFEDLLSTFSVDELDAIDFIEDPFLFEDYTWARVAEKFQIRLALDRGDLELKIEADLRDDKGHPSFAVVVIKPALEESATIVQAAAKNMRRVLFTSYLDHPLGQVCAAYEAGLALKEHPLLIDDCGLLSHRAYQSHSYSEALRVDKNVLVGAEGLGWGFDSLLSKVSWQKLR